MPIYEYKCEKCGKTTEEKMTYTEMKKAVFWCCFSQMERVITAAYFPHSQRRKGEVEK